MIEEVRSLGELRKWMRTKRMMEMFFQQCFFNALLANLFSKPFLLRSPPFLLWRSNPVVKKDEKESCYSQDITSQIDFEFHDVKSKSNKNHENDKPWFDTVWRRRCCCLNHGWRKRQYSREYFWMVPITFRITHCKHEIDVTTIIFQLCKRIVRVVCTGHLDWTHAYISSKDHARRPGPSSRGCCLDTTLDVGHAGIFQFQTSRIFS